ncbi:phosphoadenosine phosphosulfate reductase domain-containing protein [Aeropyrum camini]|uniref:phosphoadenosine phosphosulfate reductase domain-containing protein n=1 Tax=Aeropyrum camini TaxID=229980 RepID=UPI0009EB99E5|nr:phosphoadenosine phosphosulfate reductase family protein [Aeropyrum camini]
MLRVVARSRKDAKAARAALDKFMGGWGIEVESLGGPRGGALEEAILEEARPFTVFLMGREDLGPDSIESLESQLPPFSEVAVVKGSRVRNVRIETIYASLNSARARLRLRTHWSGSTFILSRQPGAVEVEHLPYSPQGDSFFVYGRGSKVLGMFMQRSVGGAALLFKMYGGKHLVYAGPRPLGELVIDNSKPLPQGKLYRGVKPVRVGLETLVEANRSILAMLEHHSVGVLKRAGEDVDTVIVPWSGGKDSTAALLVAVEAFGREAVRAVYVDTGIDFIENAEYVEKVASSLGVDLVYAKADVDDGLLIEGMPMPDPEYRWCTGRKLDALRRAFQTLSSGKTIIVTGDRDGESEKRGRRPPLRHDEKLGYPVASPLKLWSGGHVQLYILSKGIPLNPLYEAGFYRIGCYLASPSGAGR